ncbi:MAG TPA: aminopeptidase P N-terminal domain-containing protein, partial [Pricia sp.]|nr:aminopeptidase P N-terminal domain-containing protein [Pricia sp.]
MKVRSILFLAGLFFFGIPVTAQESMDSVETPTDFLPAEFHASRREAVREMMPSNSVAVFFANAVRNRANDVDYIYHQDPDFYYLTGYREPHAVLLIFAENQNAPDGKVYDEVLYVQERDPRAEQWNGKRLGVEGAKEKLGFGRVFNGSAFAKASTNFKNFDTVLFFDFENDYRDTREGADLFDLIKHFKEKANYPSDYNPAKHQLYSMIKSTNIENSANVAQTLGRYLKRDPSLKKDELLSGFVNAP